MKERSLPKESSLHPVPAALLTFRSCTGRPRFVPVNWLGMSCEPPVTLSAAFRVPGDAVCDLRLDGAFAVNLPPADLLQQAAFRHAVAEAAGDLRAAVGFSVWEDMQAEAPLIAECPVRIECRLTSLGTLFDQELARGEIVAIHLNGVRHGREDAVDFYRLAPLASPTGRHASHPAPFPSA